jgi:hypothetical protein
MLNSRVRCWTMNITTLKMPTDASTVARRAKAVTSWARNRGRALASASTARIVRTRDTACVASTRAIADLIPGSMRMGSPSVRATTVVAIHEFCASGTYI